MPTKKKPTQTPESTPAAVPAAAPARKRAAPKTKSMADDRVQLAPSTPGVAPSYDQIAEAAYLRYLSRGGSHGQDFDDWVEAERDLRSRE